MVFIFSAVILIPLYFFIQEGTQEVYGGFVCTILNLLVINNRDTFLLIITFVLVGFAQVITDLSTWQRL